MYNIYFIFNKYIYKITSIMVNYSKLIIYLGHNNKKKQHYITFFIVIFCFYCNIFHQFEIWFFLLAQLENASVDRKGILFSFCLLVLEHDASLKLTELNHVRINKSHSVTMLPGNFST